MVSIKSLRITRITLKDFVFQFHNGSIKSLQHGRRLVNGVKLIQFQFHNGSIKSLGTRPWINVTTFQFHNGSIKSRVRNLNEISIPQWFD